MVALNDTIDRRRVDEASRLRRLLAGEPMPVEVVADPDDAECAIVQDTETDTGVYMQFTHRAADGSLRAGLGPPSPVKLADTPTPAPAIHQPRSRLRWRSIVMAILAALALVVAAVRSLPEMSASSIVLGVTTALMLGLVVLAAFAVEAGRRDGIVR